jgi:hypothetical protein
MHSKLLTGLLAAALVSVATAQSQNTSATTANGVVKPTVPAPAANAPTASAAPVAPASAETNAVTQVVYAPKLPTAAELKTAAEAQGLKLERVVQTQIQVIAFYRDGNGHETTVAYQSVPPTGTPAAAPATVVTTPQTVIYQSPRVVYYDDYPTYYAYPRYYYPPVSLSFGFGFGRGFYHGGYRHWR